MKELPQHFELRMHSPRTQNSSRTGLPLSVSRLKILIYVYIDFKTTMCTAAMYKRTLFIIFINIIYSQRMRPVLACEWIAVMGKKTLYFE